MRGKFTAMASWRAVVAFSQPSGGGDNGQGGGEGSNYEVVTYSPGGRC